VDPLLYVRCDKVETFGGALTAADDAGVSVDVWDAIDPAAPRPDLSRVAGVVVFGSTYNVEHADEQPFIKAVGDLTIEAVERDVPFLGLCFGAQVLVWALGGTVAKAPDREIGFEPVRRTSAGAEDPVLSHYDDGAMVFQWHMDGIDPPDGATVLSTGDTVPTQAIRIGETTWATQFHAEVDASEAEYWISLASAEEDLERVWGKSPERLRREVAEHMAAHEARGRETFRRFVEVCRSASG
jgi:GMP synthase (glutamine-hydrolysing)